MTRTVAPEEPTMDTRCELYQLSHGFHSDFSDFYWEMLGKIIGQGTEYYTFGDVPEICGEIACLVEICTF